MECCDIMISYHISDAELVEYLHGELEKKGFDTWYIKPEDVNNKEQLAKKGNMIINCKVYVIVLSELSVVSADIKDEMSLAYISNKPLYPLSIKWYPKIANVMDCGMKLMLAKINWTFFVKKEMYEESMKNLMACVSNDIAESATSRIQADGEEDEDEEDYTGREAPVQHAPMGLYASKHSKSSNDDAQEEEVCEHTNAGIPGDFWTRHFADKPEVTWGEIEDKFLGDYKPTIEEDFGEDKVPFFKNVLYKDIFELKETITRLNYNKFVGKNKDKNKDHFYERLRHYASSSLALREVLDMESTVRLTTIRNLGQFQTKGVITLLFDFVTDTDPNIRAVAALSLAKTGKKKKRIEDQLISMLEDEDRVVRESACLSLAHMRCQKAVKPIVELWRNDAIKHVREAAEIALTRIGGEEAAQAIKVTQILSTEMTNLRAAHT